MCVLRACEGMGEIPLNGWLVRAVLPLTGVVGIGECMAFISATRGLARAWRRGNKKGADRRKKAAR